MLQAQVINPWRALPPTPPFVLPGDAKVIADFNAGALRDKRYELTLFPEPFFGTPTAPVILLTLNPGFSADDAAVHANPAFQDQIRRSLVHELAPYPFLHLRPDPLTPGARWWRRITNALIETVGFDAVAMNMFCVQFIAFGSANVRVPSQEYGFSLVRQASAREADVSCGRGNCGETPLTNFAVTAVFTSSRIRETRPSPLQTLGMDSVQLLSDFD